MAWGIYAVSEDLVLEYNPEMCDSEHFVNLLHSGPKYISRCFKINLKILMEHNPDTNEIYFKIGKIDGDYYLLDKEVLSTPYSVYFSRDMSLKKEYFIAERNISVLAKLSQIVGQDIFIGGPEKEKGYVSQEEFENLIAYFPTSTELDHYASSRVSVLLKEAFPDLHANEVRFNKYIERKNRAIHKIYASPETPLDMYKNIELDRLRFIQERLNTLLNESQGSDEKTWQEQVHGIIRLLYPKYVCAIREVSFKGIDKHDKRPDFVLVNANGYVDILEIKKPQVPLITRESTKYRNNYVPVRELAGAVQQVEKYAYCLSALGLQGEEALTKRYADLLPEEIQIRVANPQGLLLMGRSKDFSQEQIRDFEIIKRQYKHIAEIMTYDDLLERIKHMISALTSL